MLSSRNTDGCRLSLSDPLTIGQRKHTGMTGGLVDESRVTMGQRVTNRTRKQREQDRLRIEKARRKAQSRHRHHKAI